MGTPERIRALRESVISAMIYPAILLLVAVISVIAMLGSAVPQFETLFRTWAMPRPRLPASWWPPGISLPGLRPAAGVAVFCSGAGLSRWFALPPGALGGRGRPASAGVWAPSSWKYEITRFTRSLGTLLGNGVPVISALNIAN